MNKTILSTLITMTIGVFSCASFANDDWMNELNQISSNLDNADIDNIDNMSLLLDDNNNDIANSVVESKQIKETVKAEQPKAKVVEVKNTIVKPQVKVAKVEPKVEKKVIEKKIEPIIKEDPTDMIFLRNIPVGARFTVHDNYKVLPNKKYIIFYNGERVLDTPQTKEDPEKTFCFIELKNSGKVRILKDGKQFTVQKNITEEKSYKYNKSYGDYTLRTYTTKYLVDNPNIKNFTCHSAKKYQKGVEHPPRPLTLKDLREQTNNKFTIEFPAYEEI